MRSPWIRPKATFSQTRRESNKAEPWNSMPNCRRIFSRSPPDSPTVSWPSTNMLPDSGRSSPRMDLISTDLPEPEPPITTTDSPAPMLRSSPRSTFFGPKDLWSPATAIFACSIICTAGGSSGEEDLGQHVVQHQDHDRGRDHGVGRGRAHALGAAPRMIAVIAAHQRDDEAEDRRLHQARGDVEIGHEIDRVAQIDRGVEAELVDRDDIAAEDADGIGDRHQEGQSEEARDQPRHHQILHRVG